MFKYLFTVFLSASALFASEFVLLESGRTILLNDDGTYEEVTLIEKDGKQIALKKDGTWMVVPKSVPVVETVKHREKKGAETSKLAKLLVGRWESRDGATVYDFRADGTVRIKRDNRWTTTTYRVDDVDEAKRTLIVNIGEGSRLGFLSIGGEHRRFRIEADGRRLHDETYKIRHYKDLVLIRR
ncbi:hypothetical protein [Hydrogenimonas sp.]